ncbi:unnamed protein product [Trifolium pratense]|uniref:Uncharacterized protein n=1 Tax=Trifolium pratense TaxID=57577 RepID=A0ACB0LBV4_TRIPR|nr:unnamed protein product [Trifolium pratense]
MNENFEKNWTQNAVEEAEAVSSISCSGHGRAFLDGLIVHGKAICECNTCYGGTNCSKLLPHCMVDADSGDPIFLEPYWIKNAARSAVLISGWHRMSYEFSDGSLISKVLKEHIRNVHAHVGNAQTDGKYIIFGVGATHLLNAAVHSLSSYGSSTPTKVVASKPYYPVYKEQIEFFKSDNYKFIGDTTMWKNDGSNVTYIELVTSPNNPDGQLKKAILQDQRQNVKTIHDLAYYWPHYTPILQPADEDLMIFTLSKFTGHGGSRFGWAIIKDEDVYKRMLTYIDMSTYGVSRETQLRVLKLLKVVLSGNENKNAIYEFGYNTMKNRWIRLTNVLSQSTYFSIQDLNPQYCSFSHQLRKPSPAFAWLKCDNVLGNIDCYDVLKTFNITGRAGSLFGGTDLNRYVRLSLVRSEDDFDLLLTKIKKLVDVESKGKFFTTSSTDLSQRNEPRMMLHVKCCENNSLHLSNINEELITCITGYPINFQLGDNCQNSLVS